MAGTCKRFVVYLLGFCKGYLSLWIIVLPQFAAGKMHPIFFSFSAGHLRWSERIDDITDIHPIFRKALFFGSFHFEEILNKIEGQKTVKEDHIEFVEGVYKLSVGWILMGYSL